MIILLCTLEERGLFYKRQKTESREKENTYNNKEADREQARASAIRRKKTTP